MRRAMHVLEGLGAQEQRNTTWSWERPFDHPYFGQLFLASVLKITSYPDSLAPKIGSMNSIELLHLVPRLLMGILAVADTFLIYKIAERKYNRKVAFVAAILFAVMPMSWFTRRILLDSLGLPLILLSILFAIYPKKRSTKSIDASVGIANHPNNVIMLLMLSGIFLGLAIFTKLPAVTMIPLVGYLIYTNFNTINGNKKNNNNRTKSLKPLGLLFIPVILIPAIWPAYALAIGQYHTWWGDILWQSDREGKGLLSSAMRMLGMDPLLWICALAGLIYTIIRKDFFVFFWVFPFVLFYSFSTFIQPFHWISLIPAFCIGAGILIVQFSSKIKLTNKASNQQIIPLVVIVSAIAIFGFSSTILFVTININSTYFEVYRFIAEYLPYPNDSNSVDSQRTVIMGNNWMQVYSWIPKYVFNKDHDFRAFNEDNLPIKNEKVLLLVDNDDFKQFIENNITSRNFEQKQIYNETYEIGYFKEKPVDYNRFKYPYTTMRENRGIPHGGEVIIRINY
jgi:MFS family permease